jgi:type IV pilus assembly protein PilB
MHRGFSTNVISVLVEDGVITEEDLEKAREVRERKGGKFEDILVELGLIDEDAMLSYRALALETVPIHLDNLTIPNDVLELIPEEMAAKYKLIPVFHTSAALTVAMANPLDIHTIDDIERRTKLRVVPMLSSQEEIEEAIKRSYRSSRESVGDYLKKIQPGDESAVETVRREAEDELVDTASLERLAEDAPVVGLVNLILRQAVEDGASDIHIEAYEDRLRVRFRVDGVLEEVDSPPKQLHPAIVSRIKIMSDMDIAERRRPQDGRLKIRMPRGNVNLRVSTLPTAFGEKVVMRIADESKTMFGLDQLGMSPNVLGRYIQSIERPYGMILVTGPTGSGKTSTLYASLNRINEPHVNIITVEDPIEYLVPGLNQVEIEPKAGRTFANVLRAILRQDPDIVMVGEIRDLETAELAVEAALTGHLVFSTLHTNDAPGAISRLLDLEVQSFLIPASLSCIIAQRLVRVLCPNCKKPYEPSQEAIDELKLPPGDYTFFEKQGCPVCGDRGYKGRTGIYEVMFMNEEIAELTSLKKDIKSIQEAAIRDGMRTLRQAAIDRVVEGVTSVEEAFRATAD